MKRLYVLFLLVFGTLLFSACKTGVYSVNSGNPDEGYICFTDEKSYNVTVKIDNVVYPAETAKRPKDYKKRRDIASTSKNMIAVKPGKHEIIVEKDGSPVYSHTVFISANEKKIIDL